jgi:insulin-like growth factor 2 mRNA-binding protein 1
MEPASGQLGQLEKAITVYGQPENCTAACRRILEVMAEEAKNVGKDQEISLKILAHNNLIGRIIGKQGATIKKIMEVPAKLCTVSFLLTCTCRIVLVGPPGPLEERQLVLA